MQYDIRRLHCLVCLVTMIALGAGAALAALPAAAGSIGDLNGDGNDDLLLRNTDGRWLYNAMNGRRTIPGLSGFANLPVDWSWSYEGIGDFDGDGDDDVLLRDAGNGRWYVYAMDGRDAPDEGVRLVMYANRDWQLAAVGDFNGDGTDDVLLRHARSGRWYYYPVANAAVTSGRGYAALTSSRNWQLAGIGDLNADGSDDVVLRHTNGPWMYYPMAGRRHIAAQRGRIAIKQSRDWQFAGIGNFDGDGGDEILLRHANGRWQHYAMAGRVPIDAGPARITRNRDFAFVGIGDLNGDGNDDVLLRRDTGRWYYYPMDGRDFIAGRGSSNVTPRLRWDTADVAADPDTIEDPTSPRLAAVHDDNVVVLHVGEDIAAQDALDGLPLDVYTSALYSHFEDVFDFVMFFSNLDDIDEHRNTTYYGLYTPVRNDTAGIGMSMYYDRRYGSANKLRGVIHFPYNRALLDGPSLHELQHAWSNYAIPTADTAHWGFSSANGQLGGFDILNLVELGGNRYAAGRFSTNANGGNGLPYSPIELYLAGYLPPEEVPDLWVAADGDWVIEDGSVARTEDGQAVFSASDVREYSIEDIVTRNGARVPSMASAPWHFRVAIVLLTDADHPATPEQLDLLSEHVASFSMRGSDGRSWLHNYYEATVGRGSVTMDGLTQVRKAVPAAAADLPASFGIAPEPSMTLIDGRCVPGRAVLASDGLRAGRLVGRKTPMSSRHPER